MTILRTIILLLLFISCSETIDNKKLIGQYVMANDTLELLSDNSFKYHFNNNNTNSGTWKLKSESNEVTFDNFTFIPDKQPGVWYSRIILTNGEIRLNVNSDIRGGYFKKISDR